MHIEIRSAKLTCVRRCWRGRVNYGKKLLANIKTHKPAGSVKLRVIHSTVDHPGAAIQYLVCRTLQRTFRKYEFLCRSSEDVLKSLRFVQLPDHVIFFKFDVRDFYMEGTHDTLIDSFKLVCEDEPRVKDALADAIRTQLFYQYVGADVIDTDWSYQVVCGSGMGSKMSGDLSDANFLVRVEIPFACNDSVKAEHKILYYGRFRDDILVMMEGGCDAGTRFLSYVNGVRAHAAEAGYELERSSNDTNHIQFLDLEFFRHRSGSRQLCWRLYRKETAQHVPLSSLSGHPRGIHMAWPLAEIRRCHARCLLRTDGLAACTNFVQRLLENFHDAEIVLAVKARTHQYAVGGNRNKMRQIYWVLPYHPALAGWRLQGLVNHILARWGFTRNCLISWKNRYPNLMTTLRRSLKI